MSAGKGKSRLKEHPLSTSLNVVHLALFKCPQHLRKAGWQAADGTDEDRGYVNQRNEYLRSLRNLLKTSASGLDQVSTEVEKIVLGQISRSLLFIADHGLGVGWWFVQFADYVGKIRSSGRCNQQLQPAAEKCAILDRAQTYVDEFADLMREQAARVEKLRLRLSPPVRPELTVLNAEEVGAEAVSPSDAYALENVVCRLTDVADRLEKYNGHDERCREFHVARQVLQLRYDIDEARHLLSFCRDAIEPGLFEQARAVVNEVWAHIERTRVRLVGALRIRPTDAGVIPIFMDKMIGDVSARIAHANEHRSALEDVAGKLKAVLASAKDAQESRGVRQTKQDKAIWKGISTGMKKAIRDYWRESRAVKSQGKRLLIGNFCKQRGVDEETFRVSKKKVEGRRKRLE